MVVDHNGSPRHRRYKAKVANVFRAYGGVAAGDKNDEFTLTTPARRFPLSLDVVAFCCQRMFAVEINGYKGHNTRRAHFKDFHRAEEIKELVKDIECYSFSFWQLKGCPDELIAQELGLKKSIDKVVA